MRACIQQFLQGFGATFYIVPLIHSEDIVATSDQNVELKRWFDPAFYDYHKDAELMLKAADMLDAHRREFGLELPALCVMMAYLNQRNRAESAEAELLRLRAVH